MEPAPLQKQPYYRLALEDATGSEVELAKALNFRYGYALNDGSAALITCSLSDVDLSDITTSPLYVYIRIYRWDDPDDESTERLVWYGKLFDLSWDIDESVGTVTFLFFDLASQLQNRRVDRLETVSTPTDASTIMWNLINTTQTKQTSDFVTVGDLGIIQGTLTASKNREPELDLRNRPILEVLISFSENIDGVDWEITPTPINNSEGIFNTYFTTSGALYHKGNEVQIPLTLYVDGTLEQRENNIKALSVQELGSSYANSILALGSQIEEQQYYSEAENEAQQKVVGLFEDVLSATGVSEQDNLDDKAEEEVNRRIQIPREISVDLLPLQDPRFGTFDVGDIFTIRCKVYNFRDFTQQYRLYKLTVNVNENGVETMKLDLAMI